MSDTPLSPPAYGERVEQPPQTRAETKIVNKAPTNEQDLLVAREQTKRSLIRTGGTVVVFITLFLPIIIAVSRAVPQ